MNTLGTTVNMWKYRQNEPGFIILLVHVFTVLKYTTTVTQRNYLEVRMHCKGQDGEIHYQVTVPESFPVTFLQRRGSLQKVLKHWTYISLPIIL